jgi:acyl-CoA thioesterase
VTISPTLTKKMSDAAYAATLGFRLLEVNDGYARVAVKLDDRHCNFLGKIDGGVIMSLADYAFACACNTFGDVRVAAQFSVSFIVAPETGGEMMAEARTVHPGRKVSIMEISVTQAGRLIARATGTAIPTGELHKQ